MISYTKSALNSSQEWKDHLSIVFTQGKLPCPGQIGTFNITEEEQQ